MFDAVRRQIDAQAAPCVDAQGDVAYKQGDLCCPVGALMGRAYQTAFEGHDPTFVPVLFAVARQWGGQPLTKTEVEFVISLDFHYTRWVAGCPPQGSTMDWQTVAGLFDLSI
jgi:hypothetical protein